MLTHNWEVGSDFRIHHFLIQEIHFWYHLWCSRLQAAPVALPYQEYLHFPYNIHLQLLVHFLVAAVCRVHKTVALSSTSSIHCSNERGDTAAHQQCKIQQQQGQNEVPPTTKIIFTLIRTLKEWKVNRSNPE
jgi:hypothetical protein